MSMYIDPHMYLQIFHLRYVSLTVRIRKAGASRLVVLKDRFLCRFYTNQWFQRFLLRFFKNLWFRNHRAHHSFVSNAPGKSGTTKQPFLQNVLLVLPQTPAWNRSRGAITTPAVMIWTTTPASRHDKWSLQQLVLLPSMLRTRHRCTSEKRNRVPLQCLLVWPWSPKSSSRCLHLQSCGYHR